MIGRGRSRRFDKEWAIRQAMQEFWRHGYAGATLTRLKAAMGGICSPSLYAAFGSKRRLFEHVLEAYYQDELLPAWRVFEESPPGAVDSYLRKVAIRFTREGMPRGCLVEVCQVESFAWDDSLQRQLSALRQQSSQAILHGLEQARLGGGLALRMEPRRLSEIISLLISGLSSRAREGESREHLLGVVEDFLGCILLQAKDPLANREGWLASRPVVSTKDEAT